MKVVVQRVKEQQLQIKAFTMKSTRVSVFSRIGKDTTEADIDAVAKKIINARLFEDENGKLNLNIQQVEGQILSISQFTLYADVRKGNRPGFSNSKILKKLMLYEKFNTALKAYDVEVKTGEFGTDMEVEIINDGPVTIIYESQDGKII